MLIPTREARSAPGAVLAPRLREGGAAGGRAARKPAGPSTKVYVGNLPMAVTEEELRTEFEKYGAVKSVDIKQLQRPPAYAWVEFEEQKDAEDAVKDANGQAFGPDAAQMRVEFSSR